MGALIVCTLGRPIGPEASMRYVQHSLEGRHHASLRATSDHCHVRWNAAWVERLAMLGVDPAEPDELRLQKVTLSAGRRPRRIIHRLTSESLGPSIRSRMRSMPLTNTRNSSPLKSSNSSRPMAR
jgi:hypothetical protein